MQPKEFLSHRAGAAGGSMASPLGGPRPPCRRALAQSHSVSPILTPLDIELAAWYRERPAITSKELGAPTAQHEYPVSLSLNGSHRKSL
jgi:hypothetical protein